MSWIIAILVGALVGWIASMIMKTDEQQGALANILIGIVGALLGKWIFADLLGIGSAAAAGTLTLAGIIWGIVGAVILILILRAIKVLR
ncbi:MAG TPA: GlsB/YeaQ/YmgE family stress response membrane protein [bacterium]|nr:GlsB/YeaQ/YmgE family stress response membrane protein [bacterium]